MARLPSAVGATVTIMRTLAALASLAMIGLPGGIASSMSTTADPDVSLDKVCLHSDGGWVDATGQASNSVPLDVPMATTGIVGTHAALIGNNAIFDTLRIQVGLAGVGGELTWHYWDGDSFELLALDSPANLDAAGDAFISFAVPGDWAPNTTWSICAQGYYYVKVTTNNPYDMIPIADQMWTPATSADSRQSLDLVCLNTDLGWKDFSEQAANDFPLDVMVGSTATIGGGPSLVFFAHEQPFYSLDVDIGQAGMRGALTWHYWDGHAFREFSVDDGEFAVSGWQTVDLEVPSSWGTFFEPSCGGSDALYTILVSTTDGYLVPPIANQIFVT